MIQKTVQKDYKTAPAHAINDINNRASIIIKENNITSKIPKYDTAEAFISIKDHKPVFPSSIKSRLLNPSKTDIGKVCKSILDSINNEIRNQSSLIQ